MMIGIVVAMPAEISTLITQKIVQGQCELIGENIIVACSGIGKDNATKAAELLVSKGVKGLISWGCAGALTPDLKPGALLFPEKILTATGQTVNTTEHWLTHIKKNLPIIHRSVRLVESLSLIATADDKKKLHQQTHAVAVDMESAAIVQVAEKAGISSLVIRAIADSASLNVPSALSYALNTEGEIVLNKLFKYLLTHPQQLPTLIQLGLHFNQAKNKLKAVAEHLDIIINFDSTCPR
jgi:adenosylhomocysteine nucleosidase